MYPVPAHCWVAALGQVGQSDGRILVHVSVHTVPRQMLKLGASSVPSGPLAWVILEQPLRAAVTACSKN